MKFTFKLATRLFLSVAPLVTGSVFVASPSFAASESCANASMDFSFFSHNPFEVMTNTDTNTFTTINDGSAQSSASANAEFLTDPSASLTTAFNNANTYAYGDGNSYLGVAQSFAGLGGYKFNVGAGETFSFNFSTLLDLATSADNSSIETANSFGQIAFQVYQNNDDSNILLDSFFLGGNLSSADNDDSVNYNISQYISYNFQDISTSFGGGDESIEALFQGKYYRSFENQTYLTLVETKVTQASVSTFDFLNSLN
ncbi:MAG: hypothetical protein WBG73_04665 [Coleofasciculaceae cyanobacterium]